MHIPDGYLSPQTTIPALVVMAGIWYLAFRKIKINQNPHLIPSLALCAAFSFVIMMFNVPVVGGSSAHAVGAVLVAILVGPWAAIIAISTTLIIQAVVFGDGGIMAIGINCLNMAVIMPLVGYALYRLISANAVLGSKRNLVAVFIASTVGLICAALAAAIEMGVQPIFFTDTHGLPLYGFYSLAVTIPAMLISHLIAGPIDGIISMLAVAYVVKFAPQLIVRTANTHTELNQEKAQVKINYKAIVIVLIVAVILSPLGLLASGTAFGEWGTDEVKQIIGFIPRGMAQAADKWHALFPDYSIPHFGETPLALSVGYIASAIVGMVIISTLILLSARLTKRK